jgi:hypothetical protein
MKRFTKNCRHTHKHTFNISISSREPFQWNIACDMATSTTGTPTNQYHHHPAVLLLAAPPPRVQVLTSPKR